MTIRLAAIKALAWLAIAVAIGDMPAAASEEVTTNWAIAEFGTPLYEKGIEHWPYANPDAPKGGKITLGAFGSFDSLNPIILKGDWARSIGLIHDGLMVNSGDELASAYGLIAESVEVSADKSWIIFNLRPEARYHDGTPITGGDFKFGFDTIRKHGRPFLKSFYKAVDGVDVLSDHRIRYRFKTKHTMKPLMVVAVSSPIPRHYWRDRDISKTTLEPPLGSGGYRIKDLKPGRSITYERVKDYWAADLPVNRGLGNVDEIRYDYFRDATVMFEAFKAGDIDFRSENRAQRWATGYEFDAVSEGRVIRRLVPDETPRGIQAYFFNLRRPQFADRRVRAGIAELYDFEFIQRTLLYGQYRRTTSYFPNSDFGSKGEPNAAERAILEPFADKLAPEVLTKAFAPTVSDGKGRIRRQQRKALDLFKAAGWTVKDGKMVDNKNGKQLKVEILMRSPGTERLTAPLVQNLKKVGIDASMRLVDTAQFQVRMDDFDYDMVSVALNFFPPPGPELRSYYGSAAAGERGSANLAGVKDPVADALIEKIIAAKDLETLKAHSRALDRVLLWGHYVVPMFHNDQYRLAYWDRFGYPKRRPRYSHGFPTSWWIKE